MKENALESASLGTIMGCGFRYVLAEFIFPVLAISGPVGWSIEIGVVGLTVLYSLRNFIGFWKRCNCFDDVLELFYNLTIKNLSKIIESSLKKYDLVSRKLNEWEKKLSLGWSITVDQNVFIGKPNSSRV